MPVVGFTISDIQAKRGKEAGSSKINIVSTPTIKGVKEVDMQGLEKKALEVEFDFLTAYNPDMGSIKISGQLFYISNNDNQLALDFWKKKKTLPDDEAIEVLNFLFRRCVMKALILADDLQMPPPINLPIVTSAPKQETKMEATGKGADNFTKGSSPPAVSDEEKQEKELEEKIKKLTAK